MGYTTKKNFKNGSAAGNLRYPGGKTIAAFVLVSVMAILWGRVLLNGKGGPATASAQDIQPVQQLAGPAAVSFRIEAVELDQLEGRHDVLSQDVFGNRFWTEFETEPKTEAIVPETDEIRLRADLEKIERGIRLEAVIRDADGTPSQVFANDKILAVGSVLTVKEGPVQYEVVLKGLSENEAAFSWNGISITKKMTETVNK
jgi:hypothetical protein